MEENIKYYAATEPCSRVIGLPPWLHLSSSGYLMRQHILRLAIFLASCLSIIVQFWSIFLVQRRMKSKTCSCLQSRMRNFAVFVHCTQFLKLAAQAWGAELNQNGGAFLLNTHRLISTYCWAAFNTSKIFIYLYIKLRWKSFCAQNSLCSIVWAGEGERAHWASPWSCVCARMNLTQAFMGMNGYCLLTPLLSHGPLPVL